MIWRPELTAVTVILDAAPEGYTGAKAVDPLALGALLADQAGIDGRHVVVADAAGEHRLWLRDPTPGRPLAAIVPLDKDFIKRILSLLRFHRLMSGKRTGPLPRGWPLTPIRAARLELMLRALDLRLAGATYRQIAIAQLPPSLGHLVEGRVRAQLRGPHAEGVVALGNCQIRQLCQRHDGLPFVAEILSYSNG